MSRHLLFPGLHGDRGRTQVFLQAWLHPRRLAQRASQKVVAEVVFALPNGSTVDSSVRTSLLTRQCCGILNPVLFCLWIRALIYVFSGLIHSAFSCFTIFQGFTVFFSLCCERCLLAMFRIPDILVRIRMRILGSIPLTYRSGSVPNLQ